MSTSAAERSTLRCPPPTNPPGDGATGATGLATEGAADFAWGAAAVPGEDCAWAPEAESVAALEADELDCWSLPRPDPISAITTTTATSSDAAAPMAASCGRGV